MSNNNFTPFSTEDMALYIKTCISREKNPDIIRLLNRPNIDINFNCNGHTLLQYAIMFYNMELIEMLLEKGADPNLKNNYGNSPLMMTIEIYRGEVGDVMKMLLKYGADTNILHTFNTYSCLHLSVEHPNKTNIKILLEHGADYRVKNKAGKTALDLAIEKNYTAIVGIITNHIAIVTECIGVLVMAREFDGDSLCHENYLPLDLLKIFMNGLITHKFNCI